MNVDQILENMDKEMERCRIDPRQKFIDALCHNAMYWTKAGSSKEDVATGVTFSILTLIDGDTLGAPPINLAYAYEEDEVTKPYTLEQYTRVFNDVPEAMHEDFYPTYRRLAEECDFPTGIDDPTGKRGFAPVLPSERYDAVYHATLRSLQRAERDQEIKELTGLAHEEAVAKKILDDLILDGYIAENELSAKIHNLETQLRKVTNHNTILTSERDIAVAKLDDCLLVKQESADAEDISVPETYNNVVPLEQRRELFVENCANIVDYWGENGDTPYDAAVGVMHSVLSMIDGAGDVPPLDLVPAVVPELVAEYNSDGTAGWPAQSINNNISLGESFIEELNQRKRLQTAEALGGPSD